MNNPDMFDHAPAEPYRLPDARRWTRLTAPVSTMIGLILVGRAANPGLLGTLSTIELLGIVVLAVCPMLTLLAMRLDRGGASSLGTHNEHATAARIAAHDAHHRPARAHARVVGEAAAETGRRERSS